MRLVYIIIGGVAVLLGVIGNFLPLLPTTPYQLVAAWAFAKSSPRLENWLVTHPRLGPPLRDWRERGAIPARAKVIAVAAMAASLAYVFFVPSIPAYGKIGVAILLACCATFIVTRPSG